MAEPKKTSEKTKRSSGPSTTAKPKDEVIEGAAVEKPTEAQFARSINEPAKPQNQLSNSQGHRRSKMLASQSVAMVMAGIAVVLALIALAFTASPKLRAMISDWRPSCKAVMSVSFPSICVCKSPSAAMRAASSASMFPVGRSYQPPSYQLCQCSEETLTAKRPVAI